MNPIEGLHMASIDAFDCYICLIFAGLIFCVEIMFWLMKNTGSERPH